MLVKSMSLKARSMSTVPCTCIGWTLSVSHFSDHTHTDCTCISVHCTNHMLMSESDMYTLPCNKAEGSGFPLPRLNLNNRITELPAFCCPLGSYNITYTIPHIKPKYQKYTWSHGIIDSVPINFCKESKDSATKFIKYRNILCSKEMSWYDCCGPDYEYIIPRYQVILGMCVRNIYPLCYWAMAGVSYRLEFWLVYKMGHHSLSGKKWGNFRICF